MVTCKISLLVTAANREAILLFVVVRSAEVDVNQCIAPDIPSLSRQSEHAKNTIHCYSTHMLDIILKKKVQPLLSSFSSPMHPLPRKQRLRRLVNRGLASWSCFNENNFCRKISYENNRGFQNQEKEGIAKYEIFPLIKRLA